MDLLLRIKETAAFILREMGVVEGTTGVVLGTGLGGFVDEIETICELPYSSIPHFPESTVEGHDGKLIYGMIDGLPVLAMKGRFHYYEGYSMEQVVLPIRVMHLLGIRNLVLSNASGGMNPGFRIGDIMIITDHINLFPDNPLIGPNIDALGPRFPDMSEPYCTEFIAMLEAAALEQNVKVHKGVYVGVPGPCYETPAEYRYLRFIGADAVGMSTVPENIAAKHCGMKVAALSVITDLGIEGSIESVSHEAVQRAAAEAEPKMAGIVKDFIRRIHLHIPSH